MIRAILFDLDGTLSDTEPIHFEAFAEIFRAEGIELSSGEYFGRLIGYNDRDCFATVLGEHGRETGPARIQALIERKAVYYQAAIADRDVLYPGAVAFVRECAARFPLMVVTGTLRVEAETILARAQIRELFLDVIAAEEVERGKPAPDGFLAALGRLGFLLRPRPSITARECLVIEDTDAGIEAAHRAGMPVLAVCQSADARILAAAEIVRPTLAATSLDEILRILARA